MPHDDNHRGAAREALTATTFVEIVDTLIGDFDVVDVLTTLSLRCVELLDAEAAGILLVDANGRLRVIGTSSEQIHLLELFQIQNDEGPCLECFETGSVVVESDVGATSRWPQFSVESVRVGFSSVGAVPLRLGTRILGCLNLFRSDPLPLSPANIQLAQALADVASIAIVQDQAKREAAIREGHLHHALNSRIAIEQAKGMIAEHSGIDMDAAFAALRGFSRNNNRRLTDVAEDIVSGAMRIDIIIARRQAPAAPRRPPD